MFSFLGLGDRIGFAGGSRANVVRDAGVSQELRYCLADLDARTGGLVERSRWAIIGADPTFDPVLRL